MPFLGAVWLRKGPCLRLRVIREVVIDYYGPLLAVDEHLDGVAASLVSLFGQEDSSNPLRVLGNGAE